MDIDFTDVLEQSRALRSRHETIASSHSHGIPRLERALPQIDRESRRLATGSDAPTDHPSSRQEDPKALRLLSEYGFETDKIERTLQSVALLDAFEPFQTAADTDLSAYLAQSHEVTIISAIESAVHTATRQSLTSVTAAIENEWENCKRDLVSMPSTQHIRQDRFASQSLSAAKASAFASPFRHPRASTQPTPLRPHDTAVTRLYESVVQRVVRARGSTMTKFSIATEIDDVIVNNLAPRGDITSAPKTVQHLHGIFTALRYITGEAQGVVNEGKFMALSYEKGQEEFCDGAYRFLCLQFREDKMKKEIEARPLEAKRGGKPGLRVDVRAYVNLAFNRGIPEQLQTSAHHGGLPIWPQIYYCLRAGCANSALEIAIETIEEGSADRSLCFYRTCLEAYLESGPKRTLPSKLLHELIQDYGLSAKQGEDPYKRVCYVVLARLDPGTGGKMALPNSDYGLLFYSIEDYLWLRLSIARVAGEEKIPDSLMQYNLSMEAVQDEINSFGPSHFDSEGGTPFFYAFILILTGQFTNAISYLDNGSKTMPEAMHIAFILYYYGIIHNINLDSEASPTTSGKSYQFDYSGLIWRYVSRFAKVDPTTAAFYIFTLRQSSNRNELLKKLILETKEFDVLLGNDQIRNPRTRERQIGVIEQLWPFGGRETSAEQSWLSVVMDGANYAENSGDRESALRLYDIAGANGKVINLHIERMSAMLTSKGSPTRSTVFNHANQFRSKLGEKMPKLAYGGSLIGSDQLFEKLFPSFEMLLSLGRFFNLIWDKKYDVAKQVLDNLQFLPNNDGQLVAKSQELKIGAGFWADALCDRIPEVLLGAMEMLAAMHTEIRRSGLGNDGISSSGLRAHARTLVTFSGMMSHPSSDISAQLVRLEVMMS